MKGQNINSLRYPDDTVLIAKSGKEVQDLLDKVDEEGKKKGLTINCKKTEYIVLGKRESPACALKIGNNTIKQVQKFNYLGRSLAQNGKCNEEIKKRIGMAKDAFSEVSENCEKQQVIIRHKKWIFM